jgi:hypothetical protein
MIERATGFPDNVLAFVCKGRVTQADYDNVLVPAVTEALKSHDKLSIYYEVAADFGGFDFGAMWADTRVGLAHLSHWQKIAVVTDVDWIGHAVAMFGFMMPAEVRVFALADAAKARDWICRTA